MIVLKILPIICIFISYALGKTENEITTENQVALAMKEIMSLIPTEDLHKLAQEQIKTDKEFLSAILYIKSSEYTDLVDAVKSKNEWKTFRNYLVEFIGIDIDIVSQCLTKFVNDIDIEGVTSSSTKKSLKKFMEKIGKVIPFDEIIQVFYKRIINSGYLRNIDQTKSKIVKEMLGQLLAVPEVIKLLDALEAMDLPVKDLIKTLHFL